MKQVTLPIIGSFFVLAFAATAFAAACDIGEIACADSSCNNTSCASHGGKRTGLCNNNAACESGEECGCRDCILEQVNTSCSTGLCSSSGFCMENCTSLPSESITLIDIFSFVREVPLNANVFVSTFSYWILDEFGNQRPVEVGIKTW